MSKSQVTRIGCYGIITQESSILLCRLGDGLEHTGRWTLPGGGQDFGETLEETVVREVWEETGLTVSVESLVSYSSKIWQRAESDIHSFQFLFSATVIGGELRNEMDGSTDLAEWVNFDAISSDNSVDIVHRALEHVKQLSEYPPTSCRNG